MGGHYFQKEEGFGLNRFSQAMHPDTAHEAGAGKGTRVNAGSPDHSPSRPGLGLRSALTSASPGVRVRLSQPTPKGVCDKSTQVLTYALCGNFSATWNYFLERRIYVQINEQVCSSQKF